MNILVTGGAGHIGCELIPRLNAIKIVDKIVVYDNLSRGELNFFFGLEDLEKVQFVNGDILDSDKLLKVFHDIDVVIHLAAFVSQPFNHLQNLQFEQINRWGTLSVVRSIQNSNRVKSVLYMSSAAVFGFKEAIEAQDRPTPENGYANSKLNGEEYLALLKDKCNVKVIRAANVFGFNACLGIDGVLNTFMFDAMVKNEIKIFGDGTQNRPFVFIQNLCLDVLNWLEDKSKGRNLAIDFNASMNDLKDWLLTKVEALNYQYVNQNQVFPSQSFALNVSEEARNTKLEAAWNQFEQSIRIKNLKQ